MLCGFSYSPRSTFRRGSHERACIPLPAPSSHPSPLRGSLPRWRVVIGLLLAPAAYAMQVVASYAIAAAELRGGRRIQPGCLVASQPAALAAIWQRAGDLDRQLSTHAQRSWPGPWRTQETATGALVSSPIAGSASKRDLRAGGDRPTHLDSRLAQMPRPARPALIAALALAGRAPHSLTAAKACDQVVRLAGASNLSRWPCCLVSTTLYVVGLASDGRSAATRDRADSGASPSYMAAVVILIVGALFSPIDEFADEQLRLAHGCSTCC